MSNAAFGTFLAMTIAAASGHASPIRLEAEPVDAGVRLRVIGLSPVACEASYELEAAGDTGGNRSTQRGTAHLRPGVETVLSTTVLGGEAAGKWSATLRVEDCGGRRYEEVKRGS